MLGCSADSSGPRHPLSRSCTKFLWTHTTRIQTDSNPECPGRSSTPSSPRYLAVAVAAAVLVHHPVQPASTRGRWSPFVPSLATQHLQSTVQPGLSCQRLTSTSPNSGTLLRPVFRRPTPADPGRVCQAGASEQTLIPISLIFQHWTSRPKPDPKVRVGCHSRFESAADHAVALPIGSLGLINTTTSAARGARQQRQSC